MVAEYDSARSLHFCSAQHLTAEAHPTPSIAAMLLDEDPLRTVGRPPVLVETSPRESRVPQQTHLQSVLRTLSHACRAEVPCNVAVTPIQLG
jgi:hypothetical protein